MNILVIGVGVVGFATAYGLMHKGGHSVYVYDVDRAKIQHAKQFGIKEHEKACYDAVMICVNAPTLDSKSRPQDTTQVEAALRFAKRHSGKETLIAVRTTLLPTTTRRLANEIIPGHTLLCYNPEFLREKTSLIDFMQPTRIVIGELNPESGAKLEQIYEAWECPKIHMTLEEAEMTKYVANAFLAAKISFFNEVQAWCRMLKLDYNVIAQATTLDPRIGQYGAKPLGAFGGKCLPKDTKALLLFLHKRGLPNNMIEATLRVNAACSTRSPNC